MTESDKIDDCGARLRPNVLGWLFTLKDSAQGELPGPGRGKPSGFRAGFSGPGGLELHWLGGALGVTTTPEVGET
jgi:hypothetical protein